MKNYISKAKAKVIIASMDAMQIEKMAKDFYLLGFKTLSDDWYKNWNYNVEKIACQKYFGPHHWHGKTPIKMQAYRDQLLASGAIYDDDGILRARE